MYARILVTGAYGFVGGALVPALAKAFPEAELFSVSRQAGAVGRAENSAYEAKPIVCDLSRREDVFRCVSELKPDCVINLAAISHIPTAFAQPELTWQTNLQGMLNLLDALVFVEQRATFLQIGSGDCYGHAFAAGNALHENVPFEPLNPYAASKAAADVAAYSYTSQPLLKVIRARPFNHTAGGQSDQFVVSAFAKQIAEIEVGLQDPVVKVGNLDAQRCFLHLNDVVAAYIRLLQCSDLIDSGEAFNIVADKAVPIADILDGLIALTGCEVFVERDLQRVRPTDIPLALGDSAKLRALTGWQPKYDLDAILSDVLFFWRDQLKPGARTTGQ